MNLIRSSFFLKSLFLTPLFIFILQTYVIGQSNEPGKGNGKVSGKVVDGASNEPVPYATVALMIPGSETPIDGTVADFEGNFSINKVAVGNYNLQISFMGYESVSLASIEVSDKKDQVQLGMIKLTPTTQVLKEVTVEGQKSLFEEKVDRTVYNAENDATNKGGDATDVLRKVPMLSVDLDGNVSLRGSQNIMVLINNRPSAITANSVADALKQIPADMIKSVEVITSPSAKYDAEGTGGIINIITKKSNIDGYSLGIDAGVGNRGSNLGLNGSLRTGKMGFSLGGFGRYGYNITGSFENMQETRDSEGNQITNIQQAGTRNEMLFGRYQLGWDYDINKNNFINASVQYGVRNRNTLQDKLLTQTYLSGDLLRTNLQDVNVDDMSGTVDVNLNYTHTFAKPQQEISLLTQYSRNGRENNFVNNFLDEEGIFTLSRLKNLNESVNQESTIQLDYQNPIGKNQMLEIGGKNIIRQVSSDYQYFVADGTNGEYILSENSQLSNTFNYNQNISAGYLSYTLTTEKLYSFKIGTRYEYTTINANFLSNEKVSIPSYGSIVPSINMSKKLKNGNTIKAAYNRRIQRPSLQFLNPNLMASNRLNVTIGNPDLEPEFTNNFELGYNTYIKGTSLSFTGFARNTNNAIQSVRDVLEGDTIRTTYQNIGREDAFGMSIFANVNISNKLSLNGGSDVYYAVLNNNVPDPLYNASNQGWVVTYRMFGNYTLGKGWGLQGFGFLRGNQVQLQGSQGGFGMYSLNIKKDFNDKKGSIGFGAENFLSPSFRINSEVTSPIINQQSTTVMNNRGFRINFSYRIGKVKSDDNLRRRRKSVSNDDLKQGGENSGDGGMQPSAPAQGAPLRRNAPQKPAAAPDTQKPGSEADQKENDAEEKSAGVDNEENQETKEVEEKEKTF